LPIAAHKSSLGLSPLLPLLSFLFLLQRCRPHAHEMQREPRSGRLVWCRSSAQPYFSGALMWVSGPAQQQPRRISPAPPRCRLFGLGISIDPLLPPPAPAPPPPWQTVIKPGAESRPPRRGRGAGYAGHPNFIVTLRRGPRVRRMPPSIDRLKGPQVRHRVDFFHSCRVPPPPPTSGGLTMVANAPGRLDYGRSIGSMTGG